MPARVPIARRILGHRRNRIVSEFLREVLFLPLSRLVGARVALLAAFLYSGFYHEVLSVMARPGMGGPRSLS